MTQAQLQVQTGELAGRVFDLTDGRAVTLGRHRNNAIVLPDDLTSRFHVLILCDRGRWLVGNIGTPVNGTRIDGVLLTEQTELRDGQEITIGDTRLRFALAPDGAAPDRIGAPGPPTPLEADELAALCEFMARSVEEADARLLVRHALETVQRVTRATLTGFLNLDPDDPLPKVVWPERGQVDVPLSRHLNQRALAIGRTVWLAEGTWGAPPSESLQSYTDALCVPLRSADRQSIGALHAYCNPGAFKDRHRRFCEILGSHLANVLHVSRARRTLEAENERLRSHAPAGDELIGNSAPLQRLREIIARVASRRTTVLIRGESGVGKELVAMALHRQGPRRDGPLVVVNCAAIAAALPEAELFGHVEDALPGVARSRLGLFAQADEGTLFLDEVGELPLDTQAKVLRVIEGHGFRPVGATAEVRVDVRIVAATHRDLEEAVQRGAFRQDLLYRLQVIAIHVPPLREHAEDIEELVRHFLSRLAREHQRPYRATDAAVAKLRTHSWPGNVRQLWAVLESAAALADKPTLDAGDVLLPGETGIPGAESLNLEELETRAIRQALRQSGGNVTQAARLLGVARDTLTAKIRRKGIDRLSP